MNLNIFITLHLLEKRQKTFGSMLRTILLFPLAIVGGYVFGDSLFDSFDSE